MHFWELWLIALGLSMDAVAVTLSNSFVYGKAARAKLALMPLFFGFFQALMPLLGFYAGSFFAELILTYSGIVVFVVLGMIGGKMVYDGFAALRHPETELPQKPMTLPLLLVQAVVTSLDAFAVGIGFSATETAVFPAAGIIGISTAAYTGIALLAGKAANKLSGGKAELLGGGILLAIAARSLFT